MLDDSSTAISCAVCWRIAMTLRIGAPAATANVSESWKLMPQSAWPAARSVSGVVPPYGRTSSSRPASAYQCFASATYKPVWFVFGVQSSASRTLTGAPAADGDAGATAGDADDEPTD